MGRFPFFFDNVSKRFLLTAILIFSSSTHHYSQIIIREKVFIHATRSNIDSLRIDSLKPPRAKGINLSITAQPGEDLIKTTKIILPYDAFVTVTVLGGEAAGRHILYLRSPENLTIIENPLYRVGYKWLSPKYSIGTELDFGLLLKNNYGEPPSPEEGAIRKTVGPNEYEFWYNDDSIDSDYNDVIINVKFCDRIDKIVTLQTSPNSLTKIGFGQTEWLHAFANIKKYCPLHNENFYIYEFLSNETKYNLKLKRGINYGTLGYLENGNDISQTGTELYNLNHDYGSLYFVYQPYGDPPVQEDTIIINVSTTDSAIRPVDIKYLINAPKIQVTFVPNSIGVGDTAIVLIKKKNDDGSLSDFPPEQLFDFKLVDGINGGMIFIPELGYSIDQARRVRQGISFIANNRIDGNEINSLLVVNVSEDKKIWGTGIVSVSEKLKLSMIITGLSEIWPFKASSVEKNYSTNVKIKLTMDGKPIANKKVNIVIKRKEGSGGHDHPNSANLTLWGRISVNGIKGNPVIVSTNLNGEITTEEIRASEFGGEYFVEAFLDSKPSIKNVVDLIVKVPGLHLLAESNIFLKTGGTQNHNGPPKDQTDNNHWINPIVLADLDSAAIIYSKDPQNRSGKMRINDLSLPYGGLFDHLGNWDRPHSSHRLGRDVDIENKNIWVLLKIMSRFKWKYIKEKPNFYPHFRHLG